MEMDNLRSFGLLANLTRQERRERLLQLVIEQDSYETQQLESGILSRGLYAQQVEPWIEAFGVDAVQILRYEDFLRNKVAILNEILSFVGAPGLLRDELDDLSILEQDFSQATIEVTLSESTREYLATFYKPFNDELVEILGAEWRGVWDG